MSVDQGSARDHDHTHNARTEKEPLAHTPGPWVSRRAVTADNVGGYDYAIIAPGTAIIAEAFEIIGADDAYPAEANARLIAAAPDLLSNERKNLATMEWAAVRFRAQGLSHEELDLAIEQTRAVIATAVGTSEPACSGSTSAPQGNSGRDE